MSWQYQTPPDLTTADERFAHFRAIMDRRAADLQQVGWRQLSPVEETQLEAQLRIRYPLGNSQPPEPHATWDISVIYASESNYTELETDLNLRMLEALRECTEPTEEIYAIDWQHDWYSFNPHTLRSGGAPYEWAVPILPDGDFYQFIPNDYRFGVYGFPQTNSIVICGHEFLAAVHSNPPKVFSRRLTDCRSHVPPKRTITKP